MIFITQIIYDLLSRITPELYVNFSKLLLLLFMHVCNFQDLLNCSFFKSLMCLMIYFFKGIQARVAWRCRKRGR